MSSQPIIAVENLKKYFAVAGGFLHAVDNVGFTIAEGRTLGIVGESGCGKSTLGRAILRLHQPTAGKVYYRGIDVGSLNPAEMRIMREKMQIVFQDPYASLNPRQTIARIIEEPLIIHKLYRDKKLRMNRVKELIELVGLSERLYNSHPHELDGGRRQRAVIARALAINPQFIVCDEPVSALDVSIQAQILNLMKRLQQQLGLTYMFISHDLSVVKHFSNDIGVMYLGQMVEKAAKNSLFEQPLHPYTQALLSAIPSTDVENKRRRIVIKGEISSPINPKPGCRFAVRCPFTRDFCTEDDPSLQEISPGHLVACRRVDEIAAGKIGYRRQLQI